MSKLMRVLAFLAMACLGSVAHADLYRAEAAYQKKDYETAFRLFREIAELGHPLAQETLAIMYVQGEGVPRNNVLGLAWAQLARENGLGANVQPIIDQLEPRMTPEARATIAEIHAKFGTAAQLQRLPALPTDASINEVRKCRMKRPASASDYYPPEARKQGIAGSVVLSALVMPDGRARNPRVIYGMPPTSFDMPGRLVALDTLYTPAEDNGVAVPCTITFSVQFALDAPELQPRFRAELKRLETGAAARDPLSQLQYGLMLTVWRHLNPERKRFLREFIESAQAGLATAQYVLGIQMLLGTHGTIEREKGLYWLNMAAEAGQADAQFALAHDLLSHDPDAQAIGRARELLEKAVAGGREDARFFLADVLISEPDPARRDPARALELLSEIFADMDIDPAAFELRAAAQSQLGDFGGAESAQKRALVKARKLHWDSAVQEARLERYRQRQAWTERVLVY